MKTVRVINRPCWFIAISLAFFSLLHAEDGKISGSEEVFVGYTPMSPSVWNSFSDETANQSQLRDYLFREAYLEDANHEYLSKEGKMFTIPTDDLASTQRRMLSPYQREEEEDSRRDYAETITSVIKNKGVPEYMLQLLGMQKAHEGVKKIEKAVAIDAPLGKPNPSQRHARDWKFRTAFLPFQRSYKLGITNSIYTWDVQGGYTSSKGDYLFSTISARWGRFLQANTYQIFTNVGYSTLSFFMKPNMSLSFSLRREFKDDPKTAGTTIESVGYNYIF
jgi:hypothetical protein